VASATGEARRAGEIVPARRARGGAARRWLTRGWRAGLVTALAAAVAGCVSMPDSGPVGVYGAGQANPAPGVQNVGPFVSGPGPTWNPEEIVQGFLDASASYYVDPADAAIAREYLVSSLRTWDPGWSVKVFSTLTKPTEIPTSPAGPHRGQQALVSITGTVQAEFNGNGIGQYVSVQTPEASATGAYRFNLIKENGHWRISKPPPGRLLTETEFPRLYEAQDLYFFGQQGGLVPDSVFVPKGTSTADLVTHLVQALTEDPSSTTWLQTAAVTAFPDSPGKTTVLGVSLVGATAIVNLGGAVAHADTPTREQILEQLVWTIAGSTASPSPIQSVQLDINGRPWTPPTTPCRTGPSQNPVQKLAAYECKDPYPAAPANFYYADNGMAWSRCGLETRAQAGSVGSVVPVVARTGTLGSQPCDGGTKFVAVGSPVTPPVQPQSLPPMSMAAVSPDGKYLALVSPDHDHVYVGQLSGAATSFSKTPRLTQPGITSISWDREDDLWVAQAGSIWVISPDSSNQLTLPGSGSVTSLSVAPDGVRIALIVKDGAHSELKLAAIFRPQQSAAGQPPKGSAGPSIEQPVPLGPNITHPAALAWYDADDLVVLNGTSGGNALWEVPVDGQQATNGPYPVPPGTVSITADGGQNALVAGLSNGSNGKLAISPSLYGQWQMLAGNGQYPAYPGLRIGVIGDERGTAPCSHVVQSTYNYW
jgi:Lipoprotein LpqB beta-propeller domain/Sporulation and spore germination